MNQNICNFGSNQLTSLPFADYLISSIKWMGRIGMTVL